jgi:hypothetical protein
LGHLTAKENEVCVFAVLLSIKAKLAKYPISFATTSSASKAY